MKLSTFSVIYIIMAIVLAQSAAPDTYNWQRNTVSELAAQGYSFGWIMQAGFIGFGGSLALGVSKKMKTSGKLWYREIPLIIYSLAVLLCGVFSTKPFVEGVLYSEPESRLHSIFATVAGVALSITMALDMFTDRETKRRFGHITALVMILLLSILFGTVTELAGLIQRFLYAVGFGWIVFLFEQKKDSKEP